MFALAVVAGYAHLALLDSERFADKATAALSEPAVGDLVEREVADRIVQTYAGGRAEARHAGRAGDGARDRRRRVRGGSSTPPCSTRTASS